MDIKQLNEELAKILNENTTGKFVIEHGFKDVNIPISFPEKPTKSMTEIIIKTRDLDMKHFSFLSSISDEGYFTEDGKFTEDGFSKFANDYPEIKNLTYYVLKKGNRYVNDPSIVGFISANQWTPVKTYTQNEIDSFNERFPKTMSVLDCEEVNIF